MSETKCPRCGGVNLKWAPHRAIGCSDCGWENREPMNLSDHCGGGTHKLYAGVKQSRAVPTYADRIRAMSDEELAEFLCSVYDDEDDYAKCIEGFTIPYYDQHSLKKWLQMPVEEDA